MKIRLIKDCNNKLSILENHDHDLIFSYDSLIAIYFKNYLLIDSYYINYSNTTNKHIYYIKSLYGHYDESNIIKVNSHLFDNIVNTNFNHDLLENIIKTYKDFLVSLDYIKDHQKNFKYNKETYLKNQKYNDSIINLKEILHTTNNYKFTENKRFFNNDFKTVNKIIDNISINNISFDIIRTYKNKNGNIKNIQIKNIKTNYIKDLNY